MSLIHWKPFADLEELFEELPTRNGWDLAADVYEDNGNIIVKMNVAGINPDHIDIKVIDNHLHVSGQREEEHEVKDTNYHRKEIRSGSFERVIPLPCAVSVEQTTAECADGQLKIALPKISEEKKVNKIMVTKK